MADIANLVLAVDSSQVKTGTASLDGLTAAGARAEVAASGLGGGIKGAAAQAAAMAAAAQASARAATGMATGFNTAAQAARVNTLAMRETLVVARELARGNFTRLPGSLTLLAQGVGSQGGLSAFISSITQSLGLVRQLQNAELAEAAANAAAAASAVEGAAKRAAGNVLAADTELALAEAQLRVTAGTTAEGAAQVRLAEAHGAVSAAAAEAAIAENALASSYALADEAAAASAAESSTAVTGLGVALGASAVAAGLLAVAFEGAKQSADELDPSAKEFISTLGLTHREIERLKDTTVTWGDVAHGTFNAIAEAAGTSSSSIKSFFHEAFQETAQVAVSAAQVIAGAFGAAAAVVRDVKGLVASGWHGGAAVPLENPLDAFKKAFAGTGKFFQVTLPADINQARDTRLQAQADKMIADRTPKKPRKPRSITDPYDDLTAKLDEQILAAKQKLAGTAEEQARLALQQVGVELNKSITDDKELLAKHKITAGEEQHLELQARQLADLKRQAILREEETKLLTQQQAAQDQLFGFQTDALKFADEMASTQAEHRKAQLDMLSIEYQQKAYDLQILKDKQEIAGDLAAVALTQGQIDHLPTQLAQQVALTLKKTANPLEQWEQQFKPDQIIEDLQRIQVQGFDGLASAISDVITGTKSLQQAFGDLARSVISEIVQMTIKMLIFRAISSIFGGGFDQGSFAGTVASNNAALGTPMVPHFASGGLLNVGGYGGVDSNLLSINGRPRAMVGSDETLAVIPRAAANSNAPQQIEITLITEPSDDAWAKVGSISVKSATGVVGQAAPVIVKAAVNGTMKAANRPKLMGR